MKVPDWTPPTLATLTDERFSDPDWIFERKLDGVRGLAFRDGDRMRLLSRNRLPLNNTYPEITEALAKQDPTRFVMDGEIVAFEGRRTSFARLQGRSGITNPEEARASRIPVFYYVFDLLHLDNDDIAAQPLILRKRLLRNNFQFAIRCVTPHTVSPTVDGIAACERGDEGVIGSSLNRTGGRSRNWLKFSAAATGVRDVGSTAPKGSRVGLGALLLGYYQGADLVYAGKVGTGFDDATLRTLHDRLSRTEQKTSPITSGAVRESGARWVRPKLVAQVAFGEWTRDGKLRHPRYLGLRTDKKPDEVVRETH